MLPLAPQIFLSRSQQRLFTRGVPIFTYHSVSVAPAGARDPFLYTTPQRFGEQVAALAEAGYESATLDGALNSSASRRVVITFDDGCRNVVENALPVLAQHRFRAIEFLVADRIGGENEWDSARGGAREPLMDAAQVRQWLAAGHEIGSHSRTHPKLPELDMLAAREQIVSSKKRLEDLFGVEVRHFSYPHGSWNEQVAAIVQEAGYRSACTTEFGVNDERTNPFALKRINPLSWGEMARKIVHRLDRRLRW